MYSNTLECYVVKKQMWRARISQEHHIIVVAYAYKNAFTLIVHTAVRRADSLLNRGNN